jgi:hypothetical protein
MDTPAKGYSETDTTDTNPKERTGEVRFTPVG